jgi:hypothetical protein
LADLGNLAIALDPDGPQQTTGPAHIEELLGRL